jgi:hypothetical protein
MPAVIFNQNFRLGCFVSNEIGFSEPFSEEVPQEVNDDKNESREER